MRLIFLRPNLSIQNVNTRTRIRTPLPHTRTIGSQEGLKYYRAVVVELLISSMSLKTGRPTLPPRRTIMRERHRE